ncbi:DsbA family protein [Micromonospora sp. HM5-17]|uniref:DsbA family oxidoreductase n=1 Tax=Micromonospora sp. HM5-17 TaxID=2487710 RepID=UPI000F491FBC|nr:DsbA family oxidoreductase [Micromonospora sp. HM5-17]ROT34297.1 DsbA family oxidoreductase [Micromonospora sp. HM5-17]
MEIDVYADVVCPWCYIGLRRLTEALASYDGEVTVRHRPFQLDPSPVPEPRPTLEMLAEKFGGPERARQIAAHTAAVAAGVGLELRFDRAVVANSFDAHRLVWYADRHGHAAELLEALYRAHFTDGVDVGSRPALAGIAAGVGLDEAEATRFLDSTEGVTEVRSALREAHELGVTSVPTFVLAGRYAVTGAQEPATLLAALAEVRRREAAD